MSKRWGSLLVPLFFLLSPAVKAPAQTLQSPLADAPIIGKVVHYIERNYVDPDTLNPQKLFETASRQMEGSIPPFVARLGNSSLSLRFGDQEEKIPFAAPLTLDDLPRLVRQTLGFLNSHYDGRLEPKEREYLAAAGLTEALDPHSNFLTPQLYREFKIGTKGNFGGLGIVIGIREETLTVIAPLEGTPAWKAGIRAKDRITQIGEEATINMSLAEAVEKLRGPVGSRVTILVQRAGVAAPLKFTLDRAIIQIESVKGKLVGRKIALVKIKSFQEETLRDFDRVMRKLEKEAGGLEGVVLDLRNNPGGLLDQAIRLADRFLASGLIVKTASSEGEESEEAKPGQPEESLPLIVLVNEGSASASEILAGAVKYNDRGLVLGHRTFGKGTVQTVFDLKDGSALKLTIAKYLVVGDREVQSVGIEPDIELVPASVGEKTVNLFEEIRPKEEKGPESSNAFRIQYLEKAAETGEEENVEAPLEEDFPVSLAKMLMEERKRPFKWSDWLAGNPPLLTRVREGQANRIAESLKKAGIDWSAGPEKGRPLLAVRTELTDEKGNPRKELMPGESGRLRVEVENRGKDPLYQLAAVSESDDPLFSNLEFPFGRLDPGLRRSWSVLLKIPDGAVPREEPIQLAFHELHGRIPSPRPVPLPIADPPAPHFAFSYEIHDGGKDGTRGNRNGRIEPGETAALLIRVQNRGTGESPRPVLNLKNLGGPELFIEKGRLELKPLRPSEGAEGTLFVRLAPKSGPGKISLELSVRDQHRGRELTERLVFPSASPPQPEPAKWHTAPQLEITNPPLSVKGTSCLLSGTAIDDHRVRHLFIFVGSEKAAYLSPHGKDPRSFPFEVKVTLKKGLNYVTVAAQDDQELTSREQWIIWQGGN